MTAATSIRPATVVLSALALVALLLATAVGRAADDSPSPVSVRFISPTAGQTVAGNITWEVAAGEKGPRVQNVEFYIDGTLRWRESLPPYVFNGDAGKLDTTTLANGPHELKAVATDDKGRVRAETIVVTVANVEPEARVSIVEPRNGATLAGAVKWTADVSGPTPARIEFLLDGVQKWTEQQAPYVYNGDAGVLDTTQLANGAHTLKNVMVMSDGRTSSASINVTVSNTSAPPPAASAPKSTAPPAISGTPTVGATLTSSLGSWSGTDPITYTRQWERCATSCSPITGASATGYAVVAADVGFKLRLSVTARNSAGSATASSAQTAVASTAPPPSSSRSFTGWDPSLRPSFTPRRTITVTSKAAWDSAWRALQPGDKLLVSGITFTGQVDLGHKALSDWAEVHFADDVRFTGNGARGYYSVWISDSSFLRFYGGDVTNPNGHSFLIEDSNDVVWWGFRSHDSAGGCGAAFGITRPAERLDIRGEIWHCGLDLSFDPHYEPGTGLHGFYLAGGNYRTSGTFMFKVHDQPAGAAVQIGPYLQDSVIEVDARRVTFQAQSQVAGNALQWWGNGIRNVRVPYVYGEDLAGRVSETDGLYSGNPAGAITVEYGRSAGWIRLSPRYTTEADGSFRCLDCQ